MRNAVEKYWVEAERGAQVEMAADVSPRRRRSCRVRVRSTAPGFQPQCLLAGGGCRVQVSGAVERPGQGVVGGNAGAFGNGRFRLGKPRRLTRGVTVISGEERQFEVSVDAVYRWQLLNGRDSCGPRFPPWIDRRVRSGHRRRPIGTRGAAGSVATWS